MKKWRKNMQKELKIKAKKNLSSVKKRKKKNERNGENRNGNRK